MGVEVILTGQRLGRKVWRMEIKRRLSASGKTGDMLFPFDRG